MTNVTRLPQPGVILDLDSEQRPEKDIKPPFVIHIGGQNVTFADPSEIDWRDLADINHPGQLLRVALSSDDRKFLNEQALPTWKFNRLLEAYYTHYDLEDKIRTAKRQQAFEA